ncbi:MAG: hypothetical protein H0U86_00670 [Chloroflexi bacterium]|nr:hypothetical protein [Chloroflexota bacterium]
MPDNKGPSPFQRRYPPEMRERAIRLVAETIAEAGGERHGAITRSHANWASAPSRCAPGCGRLRSMPASVPG